MKLQDPAVEAGSLICKALISLRKHVNGSCEDWKSMFASLCMILCLRIYIHLVQYVPQQFRVRPSFTASEVC